jgi:DNA gyrase subunit B
MPELIERGHIYIGLPPLYKLKHGKQEIYLKDDAALEAYLIDSAVDGAELVPREGAPPIGSEALAQMLSRLAAARRQIERLAHRHDPRVLEAMLDVPPLPADAFADADSLAAWTTALSTRLSGAGLGRASYAFTPIARDGDHPGAIRIQRQHHGLTAEMLLPESFFEGPDYQPLREVAAIADGLIGPGALVRRGGRSQAVTSLHAARDWLLEEAKRGRTIQRFKGLGEMNPDQLWETTVNPETRRLLQVRIEDAVAADQLFTTLMGDVVEPRRAFIEQNALKVANLDV